VQGLFYTVLRVMTRTIVLIVTDDLHQQRHRCFVYALLDPQVSKREIAFPVRSVA